MTGLVQSQPALLRWEVTLRQGLIATTLEQLTSDDILKFSHTEKILSEIQAALTEGLQQCTDGKGHKVKMMSVEFNELLRQQNVMRILKMSVAC